MVKTIFIAVACLILGLLIGFFAGRKLLENQWSKPFVTVTPQDVDRSKSDDADPTPAAGSHILRPIPLRKAREAMAEFTKTDPITVRVTSFGNGEGGAELHVVVDNHASCTVVALRGVAYGYDAYGRAQKANKGGENYVAFELKGATIKPAGSEIVNQTLRFPDTASLGVAQIDYYLCDNGSTWSRPA